MKTVILILSILILQSCQDNTTNNAPESVTPPEWLLGKFKGEYVFENLIENSYNVTIYESNNKIFINTSINKNEFNDSYTIGKKDTNYFLIHDNLPNIVPPGNEDSVFVKYFIKEGRNLLSLYTKHYYHSNILLWR